MKFEENHFSGALKFKRGIERELEVDMANMTPEELAEEEIIQNESFERLMRKISECEDTEEIDERRLAIFKLQSECARTLARELELDIIIETKGTQGAIQLFTDILLLDDPIEMWVRKLYQGLVSAADGLWYEIVDRYDEKVICLNMYYDLAEK